MPVLNRMPSSRFFACLVAALGCLVSLTQPAVAQVNDEQNVFDWYYAAVFGTGIYRVGERDVTMIKFPYKRTLWGSRDVNRSLRLSVPAVIGVYDFDLGGLPELDLPEVDIQDVATLTVFPGLYYIMPVSKHWTVKPFVHIGYGKEFSGGEEALIYSAGVRSVGIFRYRGWKLALGNAVYYAGNTREGRTDLGFAGLEAALDASYPTPWDFSGQQLRAGPYFVYYKYSDLEFIQPDADKVQLSDQFEAGLSLQTEEEISVLGLDAYRIGIGYVSSRDFDAVRIVLDFDY